MTDLIKDDLREWAFNPTTIHFSKELDIARTQTLEQLGGNFYKDTDAIQRAIGICQSLKATIDLIESYKGVQDDRTD